MKPSLRRRLYLLCCAALAALVVIPMVALADIFVQQPIPGGTASAAAGGSTEVGFALFPSAPGDPRDPIPGCNVSPGSPATLNFDAPGITATNNTFSNCGPVFQKVKFSVASSVQPGFYPVRVSSVSGPGNYDIVPAFFILHVTPPDTPSNSAPQVEPISGDGSAKEGETKTYSVSATDPDGDQLNYNWAVLEGAAKIEGSTNGASVQVRFLDGPSQVQLKVDVDDGRNAPVTKTLTITEDNVAPTVTLDSGNDLSPDEGSDVTYNFTVSDPGADTVGSTSTDCGSEGSKVTETSTSVTCRFSDGPADSTVSVSATDSDGATSNTATQNVHVDNVAPTLNSFQLSGNEVTACLTGNEVTLSSFDATDPAGSDDTITLDSIDWGDGTANSDSSHTYTKAGTYTVKVKVQDEDGGVSNEQTQSDAVKLLYDMSGILSPFNSNGSSIFKYGSTVPVKVKITDCDNQAVSGLSPRLVVSLDSPSPPGTAVNEPVSTSAADTGDTLRFDPSAGQYIYNLSTKDTKLSDPNAVYYANVQEASSKPSPASQKFAVKKK